MVNKLLRRSDDAELNVPHERKTEIGTGRALIKIEGKELVASYEVIELNDTLFGVKIVSNLEN